jgi:hypothetical protein
MSLEVDRALKRPYNTDIDTKEHTMTGTEIIVTTLIIAVLVAVKFWIITKL